MQPEPDQKCCICPLITSWYRIPQNSVKT